MLFGLAIPAFVLGTATSPDGGETTGPAAIPLLVLIGVFYVAILVPSLALTARRLHDAGLSAWLLLLGLIPSLGGLVLLVFTLLPPSPNGARYDPAPAYGYGHPYPYGQP